jgi:hypothetical protein
MRTNDTGNSINQRWGMVLVGYIETIEELLRCDEFALAVFRMNAPLGPFFHDTLDPSFGKGIQLLE